MQDWYDTYYRATSASKAYAAFCERVFGSNFAQHGFADMAQLQALLDATAPGPSSRVLDLGCGNGAIAEYVSGATGASVTGIDLCAEAIRQAQQRARRNPRLSFRVMDMGALSFAPQSFDILLSIDTLYFVQPERAIRPMLDLLGAGGRMGVFYSHGVDPEHPKETFDAATLPADKTPLGAALAACGAPFRAWDFTQADYIHAQHTRRVMEELRPDLEAEGNLFLYGDRCGEASGIMAAIEAGLHARYLYLITKA